MSEIKEYQPSPGGDIMPDQWLTLTKRAIIRLDSYTLDDGQPDWRSISSRYSTSPVDSISLWTGLHLGIEYRIREAHRLGRASEMSGMVRDTIAEIKQIKEDFKLWELMQG